MESIIIFGPNDVMKSAESTIEQAMLCPNGEVPAALAGEENDLLCLSIGG